MMNRRENQILNTKRPVINVPKTFTEKLLDLFSILILIGIFAYIAYMWKELPKEVPSHFNIKGEPDDWSGRWVVFLLPSIGLVMLVMTNFLAKFPQLFNYPVEVTEANAERLYRTSRQMLVVLNFEMSVFFSVGAWEIIQVAQGKEGLGVWYLPILLVVILGTIGYYIYKTIKNR